MSQYVIDTSVRRGNLILRKLPFSEDTDVRVVIIPKVEWNKLSFLQVRELTKNISGNLAADIEFERNSE